MDLADPVPPTIVQRLTALAGLLAVVVAAPLVLFAVGVSGLVWVIVAGGLALSLVLSILTGRAAARRFPLISFDLNDLSEPVAHIEDAKARLAGRDYAAFTVVAVRDDDDPEASGQIWFFAANEGGIEKTSIELSYESSIEPNANPALTAVVVAAFEITEWKPHNWVLLSRPGNTDAGEAIELVTTALDRLFHLGAPTRWTARAFA